MTGRGLKERRRRNSVRAQRERRRCTLECLEPRHLMAVNVMQPMGQQSTWEDGHDLLIDLQQVFGTDQDQALRFDVVGNSSDTLVAASLEQQTLRVAHRTDQSGTARITVRARGELDGQSATDTLQLTVRSVNDPPELVRGLPELVISEGSSATLDLSSFFGDVEQSASTLTYYAVPFDASLPDNPVSLASVSGANLTLETAPDLYGFAQYAIVAHDDAHGQVTATLMVRVEPANDQPLARTMPDRFHYQDGHAVVALDLWYQHVYDGGLEAYFADVEDGPYLTYTVSTDRADVFQKVPWVDDDGFLVYQPTAQAEFAGTAVVTVTAVDRDGLVARLANGALPTFRVHVDNRANRPLSGAFGVTDSQLSTSPADNSGALNVESPLTLPGFIEPPATDPSVPTLPTPPITLPGVPTPDPVLPPPPITFPGVPTPDPVLPPPPITPVDPILPPGDPTLPPTDPGAPPPSDPADPPPSEPGTPQPDPGAPGGGITPPAPEPVDPVPIDPPPTTNPLQPSLDLQVLAPRIDERYENQPGALVALNQNYGEGNFGPGVLRLESGREIEVWSRWRDNEPDRIPEQGRQHRIAVGWQPRWDPLSNEPWQGWSDLDVRPARVVTNMQGTVRFEAPDGVKLWVPAWAVYGMEAFRLSPESSRSGTRWVEVRAGISYRIGDELRGAPGSAALHALPVAIEGLALGSGEIIARFTPHGSQTRLEDRVRVTVVSADLDVDSDNNDELSLPARTAEEDELEDAWREEGKRLAVNADDADGDNIADYLDGFNLDGISGVGTATVNDDRVTAESHVGFVPLVIDLAPGIDPRQALVRFLYSASDPASAEIRDDGGRQLTTGGIRIWTKDEGVARIARAADDPTGPGQFVAPYTPLLGGYTNPLKSDATYTVAQLCGDAAADQFTVYLEGITSGTYDIYVMVDPTGLAAAAGTGVIGQPNWFAGFLLQDSVRVCVESIVTVSAIDAVGAESSVDDDVDGVQFQFSRGRFDTDHGVQIYFRVQGLDHDAYVATDPGIDPARADYDVMHTTYSGSTSLMMDPYSHVGTVWIPDGSAYTTLRIEPRDDRAAEWDEAISIELITWDTYRSLFDQNSTATPSGGLPNGQFDPDLRPPQSHYRLATDDAGEPVHHEATAWILDNDLLSVEFGTSLDATQSGLDVATIEQGAVQVGIRAGDARVTLPVAGLTYRENDQLRPMAEVVLRLPPSETPFTRLTAICTVAGRSGEVLEYDLGALADLHTVSQGDSLGEVRLLVPGPEGLANELPTGRYDADVVVIAETDDNLLSRTLRGSVEVINRVDKELGSSEFGSRWWLDELDRLVPDDGLTAHSSPVAASRLGVLGARPESGMALIRGDNSTTWFKASETLPGRVISVGDEPSANVVYSPVDAWLGGAGENGGDYRGSMAGVQQRSAQVTWRFTNLEPDRMVQLFVHWQAGLENASNALYEVVGGQAVQGDSRHISVDQRFAPGEELVLGRTWRSLGYFTPNAGQTALEVRLSTVLSDGRYVDGVLSAGSVMLIDTWEFADADNSGEHLAWDNAAKRFRLTSKETGPAEFAAATGVLLSSQDRNGNRVEYRYTDADGDGRRDEVERIARQGGLTTTFQYSAGSLTALTDFAGRTTRTAVTNGQLTTVTLPAPGGSAEVPVYRLTYGVADGLLSGVNDAARQETRLDRDSTSQRVTRVVNPDGRVWVLQAAITDGLDGAIRLPASGRIGARATINGGLTETVATFVDPNGQVWSYQTDRHGLLVSEAKPATPGSPRQDVWRWVRDERGYPVRTIEPAGGGGSTSLLGVVTRQEFDDDGHLRKRLFADGTSEEWTYDSTSGDLIRYRDALGRTVNYTRDSRGNVVLQVEAESLFADTPDRRTRYVVTTPPASVNDLPGGLVTRETVAADSVDAVVTETDYFASGRLIGLISAVRYAVGASDPTVATSERFTYDDRRNLASSMDSLGRLTSYTHDMLDRMLQRTDPLPGTGDHAAPVTTFVYDAVGRVVRTTDPRGSVTTQMYDGMGRLTSVTLSVPGGHQQTDMTPPVTRYVYDGNGKLIRETDPLGLVTEYVVDARGQTVTKLEPSVSYTGSPVPPESLGAARAVTQFDYDSVGNLRATVDPLGAVTSYQYDLHHRRIRETRPIPGSGPAGKAETVFRYDTAGQLIESRVSDASGARVTQQVYDGLGRLRSVTLPADSAGRRATTSYTYDLRDNLLSESQPNGGQVTHQYDARDRRTITWDPDPDGVGPLGRPTYSWTYNADGTVRRESAGDSRDPATLMATEYTYDQLGRPIRSVGLDPDGVGPAVASETVWHYDAAGNLISESTRLDASRWSLTTHAYDNLNRRWKSMNWLTGRVVSEQASVFDRGGRVVRRIDGSADEYGTLIYRQTDLAYDAMGRQTVQVDPALTANGARPTTYMYYDLAGHTRFVRDAAGVWTAYQYDPLGRMTSRMESATDSQARAVTRYEYTENGELSAEVDPLGRRREFTYDDLGREVARRGPAVAGGMPEQITAYDLMGNEISTADNSGNRLTREYDLLGRVTVVTTNGAATRYVYDAWDNVIAETDSSGTTTRYVYDALGRRTAVVLPSTAGQQPQDLIRDDSQAVLVGTWQSATGGWNGTYRTANAAAATRPTATWTFSGLKPGQRYELLATWDTRADQVAAAQFRTREGSGPSQLVATVNQQQIAADVTANRRAWQRLGMVSVVGNTLTVELATTATSGLLVADAVRLVEVTGTEYVSYDARGNVVAQTDGLGNTTRTTYDEQSRPTSVTDAQGGVTRYSYGPYGQLAAVIDPVGNVTSYQYGPAGQLASERIQRNGAVYETSYRYDVLGRVESVVDRLGQVHTYRYDTHDNVVEEVGYRSLTDATLRQNPQVRVQRQYDLAGNLIMAENDASAYRFVYDALDREVASLTELPGIADVAFVTSYTRFDELRTRLEAWVDGQQDVSTRVTYDAYARPVRLEQATPGAISKRVDWTYNAQQQIATLDRFEDLQGLERVANSTFVYDALGQITSLNHRQGSELLAGYSWSYDPNGRVVSTTSSRDGRADYTYNATGQLVSAIYSGVGMPGPDERYQYDANGTRTNAGIVVGARNEILSDGVYDYTYDAQGQRTQRVTRATGAITEYRWNPFHQLVEIVERARRDGPVTESVSYSYDALGRRTGKTVRNVGMPTQTEAFVYDDEQIAFRFQDGELTNRYLHAPVVDQVLADEQVNPTSGSTNVLWSLSDDLGSVRDLIDYSTSDDRSRVVNHITYGAYGEVRTETAAAVDHIFGFTGREMDEESDLSFHRARYYDPRLGQFISEDPLGFAAGDTNLRRYVKNDPTNKVDPTGLYDQDVHFYMNYYMARYLGLNRPTGWLNSQGRPMSEALVLAYMATRVDYDVETEPVKAGAIVRSRIHFPDPQDGYGVRAGDNRVQAAIRVVAQAGDLEMFGVLLHTFEDTYAHQGFMATFGHASMSGETYMPDEPFRHPWRDEWMARAVYEEMVQLLLARRGVNPSNPQAVSAVLQGRTFDAFWNSTRDTLFAGQVRDGAEFGRIRAANWQDLILRDFGARPRFTETDPIGRTPLALRCVQLARTVPIWYARSYNHATYWANWIQRRPFRTTNPPASPSN